MEEAGFFNCVSVPDGAPPSVSSKEELPPQDKAFFLFLIYCICNIICVIFHFLMCCQVKPAFVGEAILPVFGALTNISHTF